MEKCLENLLSVLHPSLLSEPGDGAPAAFEMELLRVQIPAQRLLALWVWESYFIHPCLCFLTCEMHSYLTNLLQTINLLMYAKYLA